MNAHERRERSPGRAPWVPSRGRTLPSLIAAALVGAFVLAGVLSVGVWLWRLVDHAADPR